MQMKVDRGEFNPARTRVLHYVMNPESEAHNEHQKSKIQELEAENSVLKFKLTQQGEAASSEPKSQPPTPAVVEAELLVLRQKVIYDLLASQKQRCNVCPIRCPPPGGGGGQGLRPLFGGEQQDVYPLAGLDHQNMT